MRKRVVGVVVLLFLGVSVSMAGMADVGARAGYMRLSDADSGALLGGLFFRSDWRRVVFVDGSLFYHNKEVARGVDLELIPMQLSAMLYLLGRDGLVSPYVLGGGGVYWKRTTEAGKTDSKFDLGWHLGVGGDYAISSRMFVEADFRYIWLSAGSKGQTFADTLSDFNHWIGSVGIGFRL